MTNIVLVLTFYVIHGVWQSQSAVFLIGLKGALGEVNLVAEREVSCYLKGFIYLFTLTGPDTL